MAKFTRQQCSFCTFYTRKSLDRGCLVAGAWFSAYLILSVTQMAESVVMDSHFRNRFADLYYLIRAPGNQLHKFLHLYDNVDGHALAAPLAAAFSFSSR